jgi:NADH-quinone oxidoreductase subunit A
VEAFFPIGILLILSLILCGSIYFITHLLGPKVFVAAKLQPYECGVRPEGNARTPFKTQFYLIAVLFLLFDVEGVFFLPWALVYRESLLADGTLLVGLIVYMVFVLLGLFYIFGKDCLRLK